MLAKSKFNSIETLILQALNDMDISHEEFITIFKEKDRYEKMKYNLRSENEKKKHKTLSTIKKKKFFLCIYKNVRDNQKKLL